MDRRIGRPARRSSGDSLSSGYCRLSSVSRGAGTPSHGSRRAARQSSHLRTYAPCLSWVCWRALRVLQWVTAIQPSRSAPTRRTGSATWRRIYARCCGCRCHLHCPRTTQAWLSLQGMLLLLCPLFVPTAAATPLQSTSTTVAVTTPTPACHPLPRGGPLHGCESTSFSLVALCDSHAEGSGVAS